MIMRSIHLAALTLSFLPLAPAQTHPQIVGSWYAETRTAEAVGILFEFTSEGKFNYSLGAIRENRYRLEDGKLIITFLDQQKGPQRDEIFTVRITDGKLAMGSSSRPMAEYSRSGQPEAGSNSIVGSWTRMEERNGTRRAINWRFRNDGSAVFTFPFEWKRGVYAITGNQIRLTLDGKPPIDGMWGWEGSVLILPAVQGPSKFRRL